MIATDARPVPIHGQTCNRYQQNQSAKQQKQRHIHVGEIMIELGKVEVDTGGCTLYSRRGCVARLHEPMQQRQERLDAARRRQHNRCLVKESVQRRESSKSPNDCSSPKRISMECTKAAIKIQRAYRAHRAIQILNKLEQRILDALDSSRDSRTALPQLRARSAELAALRTFMGATPHVSDNKLVADVVQRVSGTLKRSIERVERGDRKRESEATVIHGPGLNASPHKRPKEVVHMNVTTTCRPPGMTNSIGGTAWTSQPYSSVSAKHVSPLIRPPHHVLEAKYPVSRVLWPRSSQQHFSSSQRNHWISHVLSASPLRRSRRLLTVSKIPALLTIPEDSELIFS